MARIEYRGALAESYARGRELPPATVDQWMRMVARYISADRAPIMDLGSGTGRFAQALAQHFRMPVVAVEPAEDMRRHAAAPCRESGVLLVGGRAEALPFAGRVFAAVWASQVIHHVEDVDACAVELRRVMVPGGTILIRGGFHDAQRPPVLHRYFPSLRQMSGEASAALSALRLALSRLGIEERAYHVVAQVSVPSIRELYQQARLRARSPLLRLTDNEFAEGVERLRQAALAEDLPQPVVEGVDLVVFR